KAPRNLADRSHSERQKECSSCRQVGRRRCIFVPSDKHLFLGRARPMGSLRIGPISLGERRKVAEQREMLRAVLGLPSRCELSSHKKVESTEIWPKNG